MVALVVDLRLLEDLVVLVVGEEIKEHLELLVLEDLELEMLVELRIAHLHQMVGVMMVDQMTTETAPVAAVVLELLEVKEQRRNQAVLVEMVYHLTSAEMP